MAKYRLVQDLEYSCFYHIERRVLGLWFEVEIATARSQEDAQAFLDELTNKPGKGMCPVILYPSKT